MATEQRFETHRKNWKKRRTASSNGVTYFDLAYFEIGHFKFSSYSTTDMSLLLSLLLSLLIKRTLSKLICLTQPVKNDQKTSFGTDNFLPELVSKIIFLSTHSAELI